MTTGCAYDAAAIARQLGVAGQREVVALAWNAVRAAVTGAPLEHVEAPTAQIPVFGAFVTLSLKRRLRGCIGAVGRVAPAAELVVDAGRSAAVADPRFPPVGPDELDHLELEVSLLTPLEWLAPERLPGAVRVGEHGLLVEKPPARGLLLPQVATEWNWDAATFLDETCRKAGLPRGAWREGARVARFAALVLPAPARRAG